MRDPCVLFFTSDFLTGTTLMSDAQCGQYIRLLCIQHQRGRLTNDDMLKICGKHDPAIWEKFAEIDGFYYNLRMKYETERRRKYVETRKNNMAGKNQYSKKDDKTDGQTSGHMTGHMEGQLTTHMEMRNEKCEIVIKNEKKVSEKIESKKPDIPISFPWESVDFKNMWSTWVQYKREQFKFAYKSTIQTNTALKKLHEYADGIEKNAIDLLENAMAHGWRFPVDPKENSNKFNYGKKDQSNNGGKRIPDEPVRDYSPDKMRL